MASIPNRSRLNSIAKIAFSIDRYDDMLDAMKKVATSFQMTQQERELLYDSYKGQVQQRPNSLHKLNTKLKYAKKESDQTTVIIDLKEKICKEMELICSEVIQFLDTNLITDKSSSEENTFFVTMKGDFCRYLYEIKPDEDTKNVVLSSYKLAMQMSEALKATNVIKMELFYKYASFYNKQLHDATSAMSLLDSAILNLNAELKRGQPIASHAFEFTKEELYKLANKISRPSPFKDTQQIIDEMFPPTQRKVSPDMFSSGGSGSGG